MEYIDGITIIDTSGTILFSVKFNPLWNKSVSESIVGKRFLDVFTDLTPETSTLFRCMEAGKPIEYVQSLDNAYSRKTEIEGISYPIVLDGTVVGAAEVSRARKNGPAEGQSRSSADSSAEEANLKELFQKNSRFFANQARYTLDDIICASQKMKELIEYAKRVADSRSPLLILGPTGTGKELFAHGVHQASGRRENPFVVQNCSAIPETLLESLLFGTCKGSFTGAVDRKGIFEVADGGTLFLDEIHAMPLHLQAKLLRVIQDGYVRRLGAEKERKVDVRVIAATNVEYQEALAGKQIRRDLFYRLAVLNIQIPPLRERKEDLEPLIRYFIRKNNLFLEKRVEGVEPEVYRLLQDYDWPGNVRELENVIEAAMNVLPSGRKLICAEDLPVSFQSRKTKFTPCSLKEMLDQMEETMVREALSHYRWNVSEAAKALGLPRQTLQQKMKKFGMKREEKEE